MNALTFATLALFAPAVGAEVVVPDYLQRHKLPDPVLSPTHVSGDFDSDMVDCPMVLGREDRWYMAYTGFDGDAYRMGLAASDDLVHWERAGMIFDCGEKGAWDYGSVGGGYLFEHDGFWYMAYCGFPDRGYEAGPGKIGLARAKTIRGPYRRFLKEPVLLPSPGDRWDSGGLYRPFILKREETWHLFYNAKDRTGREQTGVATSTDLLHWKKYEHNPVLPTGPPGSWDSRFASDPALLEIRGRWHLFYYGFDGQHAQDGVATCVDGDWLKWEKFAGNPILRIGPPGSYDDLHAHKPFVVKHQGVFYHYYCSCGRGERTIALATSRPIDARQ